ncbi:FeoB-associated Cys-rich membrane protein [Limosilactobacillus panis]|uniref:FeoB-associated Cys-rich membrane protein n=1 Tax=Limosilactobacillus panis TaxID=47493 RepID=A0ABT7VMT1_9LACO|nr:FeoB-associated Cys-rich membrane protein [Limosilactobacillus panis]MDM8334050.1 FeoB-associated Cys-rich membrane protein [Limosilactobacillus panis]HJA22563.1 FeoB-associated Cys-rich membrane protein [Candidatus Limosilactobacillus intestinipullorum]
MKILVNALIILAVVVLAAVIIIRTFHKVKVGGKCAACDYDCELKRLKDKHDHALQ